MPVLSNPKHERFVQELAKGKSQTEAYEAAGYKPDRGAASRLSTNVSVQARLTELQERRAVKAEITVDSLKDMFLEDRKLARELGQSAAAVSAVDKLARLYGHMIEKKEIGKPGDFDRMTEDELEEFITRRQGSVGAGDGREGAAADKTGMRGKSSGLH